MLEDWIMRYEIENRKLNVRVVWEPNDMTASVYDSKTGSYLTVLAVISAMPRPFVSIEEFTKFVNQVDWQLLLANVRGDE